MTQKLKVGIVGGTGMVGQRFVLLLDQHPWFEVTAIAASASSAGKTYEESVQGRWKMATPIPEAVKNIVVQDASKVNEVADRVDFIFCAVDMKKNEIQALEEAYAKAGTPVISNNSAHRWTPDVPMVIPEINPGHIAVIEAQRKRLGTKTGFIAVKPNCSIQSYLPAIHPLLDFKPTQVVVSTYQAISGAGKNFTDWPEMLDNVIPYIGGEEEKKRAGAAAHLGQHRGRGNRQGQRAFDYVAMHPRSGNGRPSGYGVHLLREQTVERRNPRPLAAIQRPAAGARITKRAEAVHYLF